MGSPISRYPRSVKGAAAALLVGLLAVQWAVSDSRTKRELGELRASGARELVTRKLIQKRDKRALLAAQAEAEYAATGEDTYERVFNTKDQTITDLIRRLAEEAVPKGWRVNVKVEEFTSFILLVQTDRPASAKDATTCAAAMVPVFRQTGAYLSNVAVYDVRHRCFCYMDADAVDEVKAAGRLDEPEVERCLQLSKEFDRYDSIEIPVKVQAGHLFVMARVGGEGSSVDTVMMVDTGASTSLVTAEVAEATGKENLATARRMGFQTVQGRLWCPIVARSVGVGGISKKLNVGVNEKHTINLLGVDFFGGLNYLIDSANERIYVWQK